MRPDPKAYLHDIAEHAAALARFTAGKSLEQYLTDEILRRAVEREFAIVGEALSQLARLDRELAERITDSARIIAFRNVLIHWLRPTRQQLRLGYRPARPASPTAGGSRLAQGVLTRAR
jgi:uncharacterized protein with HEPN domain